MKMNKYEEAYESVYQLICELEGIKTGVSVHCVYDEDLEALKELVDKETPKMPTDIPSGHIPKHGKCPNCGSFVVLTCSNDRCRVCGQRLDWGEKDD